MSNILDYLRWRGDIMPHEKPLSDVDYLVLSRMAYLPFDGVVPADFNGTVPASDAASSILDSMGRGEPVSLRIKDDEELLRAIASSPRFGSMKLCGFENVFDAEAQEQFCAVTAVIPGVGNAIVFRGTDGTLVGWKEDFDLSLEKAAPAQLDAAAYTKRAIMALGGPVMLCGHSKGGNLAVYSAASCDGDIRGAISAVRNFDGPGFDGDFIAADGFLSVRDRIRTVLPQSSVIGMLLCHDEDFMVIQSGRMGIFQHNVYQWEIERNAFVSVGGLTNSSVFVDATLKEWVRVMPVELREKMINSVYDIFAATDVRTLRELWSTKSIAAIIKAARGMDEETKTALATAFHMLKGALNCSVPQLLDRLMPEKPQRHAELARHNMENN